MNKKLTILVIVAVVLIIAAAGVYFLVFKKDDKEGDSTSGDKYRVNTEETALNVRESPSINADKIGTMDKDSIVTVSKTENGWGYLPDHNGWVCMDYLVKA